MEPPSPAAMLEEIDRLSQSNRDRHDAELELRIRELRHRAALAMLDSRGDDPRFVEASGEVPPVGSQSGVPEIGSASALTPQLLRSAILDGGCLLVRGLIDPARASGIAEQIESAVDARRRLREGEDVQAGLYDEIQPDPSHPITTRELVEEGGGLLAIDSPHLLFEMLESFREVGLREVIETYLGERVAISAQKCTLRKASPQVPGAWHQDGSFLGEVRTLNVWVSLSRCGDVAPSMDLVPRRLDELVETGGEGTWLPDQIGPNEVAEATGDREIVRPIFDPGDALIFDDLFLHQTGSDPEMPNIRYAIESWFFGASGFPRQYTPIAL